MTTTTTIERHHGAPDSPGAAAVAHDGATSAARPGPWLWTCTWETGPDAGGQVELREGRALVGRAPAAGVRCDDPALQPHHAMLVVDDDGLRVVQLTGRAPLLVDGAALEQATRITEDAVVEVGQSLLRLSRRPPDAPTEPPAHVRDGQVLRTSRTLPRWSPEQLVAPDGDDELRVTSMGLAPALCAAVAAVVLAVVLGQWMILAFGLLGAIVAIGGLVAQRVGLLRRRRRRTRAGERAWAAYAGALAEQRAAFAQHVVATSTTAATALATIRSRDHRLWSRRSDDPDAFAVTLGIGEVAWQPAGGAAPPTAPMLHLARHEDRRPPRHTDAAVGSDILHDVPVTFPLGPGARLAVCGAPTWTAAITRALVVQLAANCGPADVRVVVVSERASTWSWATSLPHAALADGTAFLTGATGLPAVLDALDQAPAVHVVIVTDAPELLASRTSAVRRAVGRERQPALVVLVGDDDPVPPVCTAELRCPSPTRGAGVWARWTPDVAAGGVPAAVRVAGIGARAAAQAIAALRGLHDPDDPLGAGGPLPTAVSLSELLRVDGRPLDPAGIVARWQATDGHPRAPIGLAADGLVEVDLVRDGPHGLIAGTTGSGKSELLRSLVAGMAANAPPERLTFVLVDYKGGATFDACADLPHVVGLVTDLDEHLGDRMLRSLQAELRRREAVLRAHGATDLTELADLTDPAAGCAAPGDDTERPLARLVVVIDEFAALVAEQPAFLHALVGVAQRGRSLGVHLVLATQRPGGVLSDDIRANTNIRCALRLTDTADALDVVGDTSPVALSRRAAGRAVLRLGPDEHVTFQAASCTATDGGPSELAVLVRTVRDAHRRVGGAAPPRPWCPALPAALAVDDERLDAVSDDGSPEPVVGLVDEPDRQRQLPLRWRAEDGHHLVGGGRGSGLTSTLLTVAHAAVAARPQTHLYVIDAHGDAELGRLSEHPACAGVVGLHEAERLRRLLLRLAREIDERPGRPGPPGPTGGDHPPVVVLIDGYTELREHLGDLTTEAEREALERVLAHGARGDIVAVLAVGQPSAVPPAVLARCDRRWLLHLADEHGAVGWGFRAGDVPPPIAGRVAVAPGVHAQLVRPVPRRPPATSPSPRPIPIEALAPDVDSALVGTGSADGGAVWLPVGLEFETGAPVHIGVPDGEHVLVLGPARSGRTTALWRLVDAWREAHPTGWCGVITPRARATGRPATHDHLDALLTELPPNGPALLAVDDAELVGGGDQGTDGGALSALAASRRPGLVIVAAGTAAALRQTYGHWTGVVRRSRLGLVLGPASELDGDLLGAQLPRRQPVPARPGLAWLVAHGEVKLVQVARHPPCHDEMPPVA